ncbi:MAG TPA: hypothetical protein VNI84_04055 [Pyrinomonadaceae bacterium]|nr:hypothetical protein [Pyrinomonadaceae bacterium]
MSRIVFTNKRHEQAFRRALANVKVRAKQTTGGLEIRPEEVNQFGIESVKQGLMDCRTAQTVILKMDKNGELFLRFEIEK